MIREQYDAEAAQVILGHASLRSTEIYAKKSEKKAAEIMERIG